MEVQVEPKLLSLIATVEGDISKVVSEALNLWLKEKIPTCPITKDFCGKQNGPCNDCFIMNREN